MVGAESVALPPYRSECSMSDTAAVVQHKRMKRKKERERGRV